jgi:hypothetical protein
MYVHKIKGNHQLGYSACIREELEYDETAHAPFINFKKTCNSIWIETLYNILTEPSNP